MNGYQEQYLMRISFWYIVIVENQRGMVFFAYIY